MPNETQGGGYNVRHAEVEEVLRELGRSLKTMMPRGWGFTVLMFDYDNTNGSLFYLSSAKREDMITAMKEFIRKETQ